MFTICLILSIVCALLALVMIRNARVFYKEYRAMKAQDGHRWCGDYFSTTKRNLEEQTLAIIFFAALVCFFITIMISIK